MFELRTFDARTRTTSIATTLFLLGCIASAAEVPPENVAQSLRSNESVDFTLGEIPPLTVASDEHLEVTTNGVKFDVFFNRGPKFNAAIYAINTGRRQLVLTPEKHRTILENLVRRKFTVIVADFKEKRLPGLELERYIVQLTEDARAAADGTLHPPLAPREPKTPSRTETVANDYFTLMPGFTVERDVAWFRYADVPQPFRQEIARQLDKPLRREDEDKTNTYDIIYPVYGPSVGVLTNYGSNERGREEYYPRENKYLVMAFAFKNLAIVHQQYFNDPIGGYHKGYDYYGDEFATCFLRHLKGNAAHYRIDAEKICCFGHSKGSEVPGMLVNKLRAQAPYLHAKANWKKVGLSEPDKTIPSPYSNLSTDIACAILGAGAANNEMLSDKMMPWNDEPAKNISPFFIFADHGELMRKRTRDVVAKAKSHGVTVEALELDSHTWPFGTGYDRASEFADRILRPKY